MDRAFIEGGPVADWILLASSITLVSGGYVLNKVLQATAKAEAAVRAERTANELARDAVLLDHRRAPQPG